MEFTTARLVLGASPFCVRSPSLRVDRSGTLLELQGNVTLTFDRVGSFTAANPASTLELAWSELGGVLHHASDSAELQMGAASRTGDVDLQELPRVALALTNDSYSINVVPAIGGCSYVLQLDVSNYAAVVSVPLEYSNFSFSGAGGWFGNANVPHGKYGSARLLMNGSSSPFCNGGGPSVAFQKDGDIYMFDQPLAFRFDIDPSSAEVTVDAGTERLEFQISLVVNWINYLFPSLPFPEILETHSSLYKAY